MKLHLGVLDVPYADGKGQTTGDVAEILEHKYGVMEAFARIHEEDIAKALEQSFAKALEDLNGGAMTDPFSDAMNKIQTKFREFLFTQEAERVGIPGTPTKAALAGVNHRKRHPYAKANPRRPSFIDRSLYETTFRAWIDE